MSELTLQVNSSLSVCILPSQDHEFLMTTNEVATGYGVTPDNIRRHKSDHQDELIENKHYVSGVSIAHTTGIVKGVSNTHTLDVKNQQPHQIFWTKRGIVRLGFFIKSDRARQFRDWAEDLVIFAGQSSQSVSAEFMGRISALEDSIARLTAVLPAPTPARPSVAELKTTLRALADKWLMHGDLKRIAEKHGYSYRHVAGNRFAPDSQRVMYLIYDQCIANQTNSQPRDRKRIAK